MKSTLIGSFAKKVLALNFLSFEPLWSRPTNELLAAGGEGELLLARVRFVVIGLLLITPTYKVIRYPDVGIFWWGWAITLIAMLSALFVYLVVTRVGYRPWLGFYSSLADVSFVSIALLLFMIVASPLVGLNSKVTFETYFIAIAATAVRSDVRIAWVAGMAGVLQYTVLNWIGTTFWDISEVGERFVRANGVYTPIDQLTRVILLCTAVLLAVVMARRAKRLMFLADHDALTGIANRSSFDRRLSFELERAEREHQPVTVAIVDADRFKQINDDYGHQFGDRALRCIAVALARGVRRQDLAARYGGEEFGLVLPGVRTDEIEERLEALRREVSASTADLPGPRSPPWITVSIGAATWPDDAESGEDLIAAADRRLYLAKEQGRDRVVAD